MEKRHRNHFRERFRGLTADNGIEFLDSQSLEASCVYPAEKRTTRYYAHPCSTRERRSNEKANTIIRCFIPKGTGIGKMTAGAIRRTARRMISFPRRILGCRTAEQVFSAV